MGKRHAKSHRRRIRNGRHYPYDANALDATGTINFDGGTLRANASSSNFINPGVATYAVNVLSHGDTFDTNGYAVTVQAPLRGIPILAQRRLYEGRGRHDLNRCQHVYRSNRRRPRHARDGNGNSHPIRCDANLTMGPSWQRPSARCRNSRFSA